MISRGLKKMRKMRRMYQVTETCQKSRLSYRSFRLMSPYIENNFKNMRYVNNNTYFGHWGGGGFNYHKHTLNSGRISESYPSLNTISLG